MNSDPSPELQPELLDDFYAECDDHLVTIRAALIFLEKSVGKAEADASILEELFRNFHSFKGICALVGLRGAEELAHAAEDFLRELSRGRATLTPAGLELLIGSTQKLEQIVAAFRSGTPVPPPGSLMASLRRIAGTDAESLGAAKKETSSQTLPDGELERAREKGLVLWQCTFIPKRELDERGININSVRARLSQAGEILRSTPKILGEGLVAFLFVLGARETPADISNWEAEGISASSTFPVESGRNG